MKDHDSITIGRVISNDGEEAKVMFRTGKGVAYTRVYPRGGDDIPVTRFLELLPVGARRVFALA